MGKGKAPAFQFYPGDWFREPGLRTACIVVRGCWAETLFTMHDTTPRGLLDGSVLDFARMWRVHPQVACYVVSELDRLGIADIEYGDADIKKEIEDIGTDCEYTGISDIEAEDGGAYIKLQEGKNDYCPHQRRFFSLFVQLKSRRMHGEWISKENERLRGKRRRKQEPVQKTSGKSPSPSSSSSSSSSSNTKILSAFPSENAAPVEPVLVTKKGKKLTGRNLATFMQFWDAFGYKRGKAEAAEEWHKLRLENGTLDLILAAARAEASARPAMLRDGRTPKMAQGWLSGRRWEDEDALAPQQESEDPYKAIMEKYGAGEDGQ